VLTFLGGVGVPTGSRSRGEEVYIRRRKQIAAGAAAGGLRIAAQFWISSKKFD